MKILFLTTNLEGKDGWSRYSLDLINEIKKNNEVIIVCQKKSGDLNIQQYAFLGNPLKYIYNIPFVFLKFLQLRKILIKEKPNIIHALVEPYALLFLFISQKYNFFITIHGTYSVIYDKHNGLKRKIIKELARQYYKKVNKIISVSNFTKKYLIKNYPEFKNKIKIISNGINNDNIISKNQENKSSEKQIKNILFVGAVKKRKGLLEVIEILKNYKEKYNKKFIYNIVGKYNNDEYYKLLKQKINEYKLDSNIKFLGRITDEELNKIYNLTDLFLMLPMNDNNKFEGFGLVYLEANAHGIPVIGSLNSGAEDAIINNQTGFLVDPQNIDQVAEKIDLILSKKNIISSNCFKWAKQSDIELKIKKIIKLYEKT